MHSDRPVIREASVASQLIRISLCCRNRASHKIAFNGIPMAIRLITCKMESSSPIRERV